MFSASNGSFMMLVRGLPDYLRQHFSDKQRYLIIWILTGLACGLAAVAFHLSIDTVFHAFLDFAHWLSGGVLWKKYFVLFAMPVLGGAVTGWILCYLEPAASGSGIPRTKAQYYREFGRIRLREAIYRFVAGTISVGSGMSLGREGPTVHICSAIASRIGQVFGLAKQRVQAMVPLGMGAGISAAFNTPMAAVFFVFEELLGDFSSKAFFGIFVSVVIATAVQRILIGEHPAFDIELGHLSTDWWMLLSLPLGVISAVLGRLFVHSILRVREAFRQSRIALWMRPSMGGLAVGLIGVTVAALADGNLGVFGIGYRDLNDALNGRLVVVSVVLLLLFGKLAATILAYGSGGSGGLFAPTLFIGGMLGALGGLIAQPLFGYENDVVGAMALLGMGTFFAAVIRCPMTSIVIISEMTGQYALILPLMAGNMLAWVLAGRLNPVPLYDALLVQDGINLKKMPQYRGDQDWRNLPVSTIMTFDPISLPVDKFPAEILSRLRSDGIRHHAYPIIGSAGELAGMVTHHELEQFEARRESLVDLLGGRELVSLTPETSIREAARILVMRDVLQAPVVSNRERLVGILTLHDIARQQNAIDESLGR
jgi:CIC family chloride channel protein